MSNAQETKYEKILKKLYKTILVSSVVLQTPDAANDELQQAIIDSIDLTDIDISELLTECSRIQGQLQVLAWSQEQLDIKPVQGFDVSKPTSAIEKQLKMTLDTYLQSQTFESSGILLHSVNCVYTTHNWHFATVIAVIKTFYKSFKKRIAAQPEILQLKKTKKPPTKDSGLVASAMGGQNPVVDIKSQHCDKFANGTCRNKKCPRIHDERKRKQSNNDNNNGRGSGQQQQQKRHAPNAPQCNDFLKGRCTRNPCRFNHQTTHRPQSNQPCWSFSQGNYCRFGNACRFMHGQPNQQQQLNYVPKYGNAGNPPANVALNAQALLDALASRVGSITSEQLAAMSNFTGNQSNQQQPATAPTPSPQIAYHGADAGQSQQQVQQQPQQTNQGKDP